MCSNLQTSPTYSVRHALRGFFFFFSLGTGTAKVTNARKRNFFLLSPISQTSVITGNNKQQMT